MGYDDQPKTEFVREQLLLDKLRSKEQHLILIIPVAKNIQMCAMIESIHNNCMRNDTIYVNETGAKIKWLKSGEEGQ